MRFSFQLAEASSDRSRCARAKGGRQVNTLLQEQELTKLKPWNTNCPLVYGPIWSRRFQLSLGINLLSSGHKLCNFDCLYCQCGWTDWQTMMDPLKTWAIPTLSQIKAEVRAQFQKLSQWKISPDWIMFSGNGEPAIHPSFPQAVALVEKYRERYLRESRLGILTNGSNLNKAPVFEAVSRMQAKVIKLDAGLEWLNRPLGGFDLEALIPVWAELSNLTIQSFFCEGKIDNTGESDVALWIERIERVRPRRVQIYTLDRVPAAQGMTKASLNRMTQISRRLVEQTGIEVSLFE